MLNARYFKKILVFKTPARTSRNTLYEKECWYIEIWNENEPNIKGIGECGFLKGLSFDDYETFESTLSDFCKNINNYHRIYADILKNYPSIIFGVEQALLDLKNGGKRILFPSAFTQNNAAININGLIWMDSPEEMIKQIDEKISDGFGCIKMKVGSIDFSEEIQVIEYIRKKYGNLIEIRVDANGAFTFEEAIEKLKLLKKLNVHSIEQPLKKGEIDNYKKLCALKIIPIALDEELIGINTIHDKRKLLKHINPDYIVLKPGLLGGFKSCNEWITLTNEILCGWWVTSALESNIGLNAIAQWTYTLNTKIPQGLGTGSLYINNFDMPLEVKHGKIYYNKKQ